MPVLEQSLRDHPEAVHEERCGESLAPDFVIEFGQCRDTELLGRERRRSR
jgi:hypothetical protein